jgi:hypothetical protein
MVCFNSSFKFEVHFLYFKNKGTDCTVITELTVWTDQAKPQIGLRQLRSKKIQLWLLDPAMLGYSNEG